MAQLKDTVVSGSLRATDTLYAETLQFRIIRAPTSAGGTTYGPGTNGQVLKSNGSSIYWATDEKGVTSITPSGAIVDGNGNNTAITSSGTIKIKSSGITNDMLAGSIANGKLSNSKITIAGQEVSLGGSLSSDTLAGALGISNAMHFKGVVASLPAVATAFNTYNSGDVILVGSKEYVFNKGANAAGSSWIELGDETSFKVKQTAVADIAYDGTDTSTTFVSAVTQDVDGVVTITKRKLPNSNTSTSGIVQLTNSYTSTDDTLAATGKSILAAIETLDVSAVGVDASTGNKFICKISETDGKIAATLSTKSLGSSTKSIYLDTGEIKEGSTYAGGTKVKLNNSDKGASTADFYAPTGSGTANQVLISGGSGTAPSWTTNLNVGQGGTGVTSFTANSLIMSGSTTTGALTTRAITNNTTATAIPNDSTNIPTLQTIYYGLPTINNAHTYTSSTSIYAPTSAGTANQILVSAGGTSAPTWLATAAGAAYASGANNALTFGTLSVGYGGTGQTSFTTGNVLVGNGSSGFTTIAKTSDSTASTIVVRDSSKNFAANKITLSEGIDTPLTSGTASIINIASKVATISSGVINMSYFNSGIVSNQPSLNWYYTKAGSPNTDEKIGSIYWDIATKKGTFLNIISSTIFESFTLPEPTTTITESKFYNILTTKGMSAGALYATGSANNTLTWNTLPLEYGGTGVTSLADLFSAIKGTGSDGLGDATWVNVTGDTISGQLILSSTTALASGTTSASALIIGTDTGVHLAFDPDSIMAKNNKSVSTLNINEFGGNVNILKASDTNYSVNIRSTKTSSSSSTGALVVSGGLGVGDAIYSGSSINAPSGNLTAGTKDSTAAQRKIMVQAGAGQMYLYSDAATTGNRGLKVPAHGTGSEKTIISVDKNNEINLSGNLTGDVTGDVTGDLTGNADTASLLKPIATDTTTASASTWGIPTGSYQVWGERFSDTRLKYTNSNNEQVTITDTGDLVLWLTPTSNSNTAKLSMKIDGSLYATSFEGNVAWSNITSRPANAGTADNPVYWNNNAASACNFTVSTYNSNTQLWGIRYNGTQGTGSIITQTSSALITTNKGIFLYGWGDSNGTIWSWQKDSNGNWLADRATALNTARTLTIGLTGKTFDGSGNVSWSLADIGAIPLTGSTAITNSLGINATAKGYFLTDSTGNQYAAIYDNGSNLWIGSTQQGTTTRVHTGNVYINAGWNGTAGNSTAYICVPTSVTGGGSSYAIAHAGNVGTGDSNGQVKIAGTNVSVKGLGSNAYTSTSYLPTGGGTMTGAITLTSSGSGLIWKGNVNITCTPTAANQNYSIDLGNAYTGTYWLVYSGKNSKTILACYNDDNSVTIPNGTLTVSSTITSNNTISAGQYTANTAQSQEFQVICRGGAGIIYMYSQAAKTANRGIYGCNSAGTSSSILSVDQNNAVTLNGHASSDLALTGGTLTGNLTMKATSPAIVFQNTGITTMTSSNNGVGTEVESRLTFYNSDASKWLGNIGQVYQTSGNIYGRIYVRNYKTDGSQVNNWFSVYSNKDGTQTYSIGNTTNFRTAIGASSGTWPVSIGGTGATSFTANCAIISGSSTTSALTTRAITNNTSATAVTASTNLITANTLYYHKGNSNIVTVGTIASGTWHGSTVGIAYGGTGATTALGALSNLQVKKKTVTAGSSTYRNLSLDASRYMVIGCSLIVDSQFTGGTQSYYNLRPYINYSTNDWYVFYYDPSNTRITCASSSAKIHVTYIDYGENGLSS